MKNLSPIFLAVVLTLATSATASANDCASKAEAAAAEAQAELLSAKTVDGVCVVRLSVGGKEGVPPRIITKKLG